MVRDTTKTFITVSRNPNDAVLPRITRIYIHKRCNYDDWQIILIQYSVQSTTHDTVLWTKDLPVFPLLYTFRYTIVECSWLYYYRTPMELSWDNVVPSLMLGWWGVKCDEWWLMVPGIWAFVFFVPFFALSFRRSYVYCKKLGYCSVSTTYE